MSEIKSSVGILPRADVLNSLSLTEAKLILYISDCGGQVDATIPGIAHALRCTVRNIEIILKDLQKKNLITVTNVGRTEGATVRRFAVTVADRVHCTWDDDAECVVLN